MNEVPIDTTTALCIDLTPDTDNRRSSLTLARLELIASPRPAVNDPVFKIASETVESPTSVRQLFSPFEEPTTPTVQDIIKGFQNGFGIKLAGSGEDLEKALDKELQELNVLKAKYSESNTRPFACQSEISMLIEGQTITRHRMKEVFTSTDSAEGRHALIVQIIGDTCERTVMSPPEIKIRLDEIEKEHQDRAHAGPKIKRDKNGFLIVRSAIEYYEELESPGVEIDKPPLMKPPSR